jgi:pimeloyl-ACP methyl ester carboxylesterase
MPPMLQDRTIEVEGHRTRYWEAGEVGSGASTVVLLHGIGCSVLEWQHNVQALAERHRVLVPDLLGFGLTDKPAGAGYGLPRLTRFVLSFMSALGARRAHLAGNSLGGRLALQCAIDAPARVASLLLADPAGIDRAGTLLEFRLATVPGLGELLTRPHRMGLRMLWRKAFADPDTFVTPELVDAKFTLASLPGAHAAFLQTLRDFVDLRGFRPGPVAALQAALPGVSAPTLVIWGQGDRFVPPRHAEPLRRLLPQVEVQLWERCGHAPQVEQAERFNRTALDFWARVDMPLAKAA